MPKTIEIIVPQENVNDEFAKIIEWKAKNGDMVSSGDQIVELETAKALYDIEAEEDGYLFYKLEEGDKVKVGQAIAYLCKENIAPPQLTETAKKKEESANSGEIKISAKAKKLMKEFNVTEADLSELSGVIKEKDIREIAEKIETGKTKRISSNIPEELTTNSELSMAKLYEIQQLIESTSKVISSNVTISLDMQKANKKLQTLTIEDGGTVTIGELIIYELGRALKNYPMLNAFYEDGKARVYNEVNVGVAINLGYGLKVPVIKNIDQKELKDISSLLNDLSLKYMREELNVKDIAGGTFTVTDLSSKGVIHFVPVINNYQSAILGICAQQPDTSYCQLIVVFDHRLTDGMEVAEMLADLKAAVEK